MNLYYIDTGMLLINILNRIFSSLKSLGCGCWRVGLGLQPTRWRHLPLINLVPAESFSHVRGDCIFSGQAVGITLRLSGYLEENSGNCRVNETRRVITQTTARLFNEKDIRLITQFVFIKLDEQLIMMSHCITNMYREEVFMPTLHQIQELYKQMITLKSVGERERGKKLTPNKEILVNIFLYISLHC